MYVGETLAQVTTSLCPDSIEAFPDPTACPGLFACGAYKLVSLSPLPPPENETETNSETHKENTTTTATTTSAPVRVGQIDLFQWNAKQSSLTLKQKIDTSGVLDLKWCHLNSPQQEEGWALLQAASNGTLQLFAFDPVTLSLQHPPQVCNLRPPKENEHYQHDDDEDEEGAVEEVKQEIQQSTVMALCLDYNERTQHCVVGLSNGKIVVVAISSSPPEREGRKEKGASSISLSKDILVSWQAHDAEIWSVCWDRTPHEGPGKGKGTCVVYSGADDGKLKIWSLEEKESEPTPTSSVVPKLRVLPKCFVYTSTAGVTCLSTMPASFLSCSMGGGLLACGSFNEHVYLLNTNALTALPFSNEGDEEEKEEEEDPYEFLRARGGVGGWAKAGSLCAKEVVLGALPESKSEGKGKQKGVDQVVQAYCHLPGSGIWRLKWRKVPPDSRSSVSSSPESSSSSLVGVYLAVAGMRAGAFVLSVPELQPLLTYDKHPSEALVYGIDWLWNVCGRVADGEVLVSCSFYDCGLQLFQVLDKTNQEEILQGQVQGQG